MSEKLKVARRGLEGILRLWGRCLGCLEGVQKVYRVSGRCLEAAVNTWANIAWKNRTLVRCLKTCLFSDILSIGHHVGGVGWAVDRLRLLGGCRWLG